MTMQFIASQVVPSSGTYSYSFNSIPQNFTHLQLRSFWQGQVPTYASTLLMQFNGDTSGNYAVHWLWGEGNNPYAYSFFNAGALDISHSNNTNQTFSDSSSFQSQYRVATITDILDYTNANKFKTIRSLNGIDYNRTGTQGGTVELISGLWSKSPAAAITSITLSMATGGTGFAAGSRFDLYGISTSDQTGA